MTNAPTFTTLADARTYYLNSGVLDWEWFDGFNEGDLIMHLYRQADGVASFGDLLSTFLREHGENPADYSL